MTLEFCALLNISLENAMPEFQCRCPIVGESMMGTCTVHVFTLDCSITIAVTTIIVESHYKLAYPQVQDTANNDAFHRYGGLCAYSHIQKSSYRTGEYWSTGDH